MAKQPKPKKTPAKPKEGVAVKVMKAPGNAFAAGMKGIFNATDAAKGYLQSKGIGPKKPTSNAKPKAKSK
jgi:hypothetical protein